MPPIKEVKSPEGMYDLNIQICYHSFFQDRSESETDSANSDFECDIDSILKSVLKN